MQKLQRRHWLIVTAAWLLGFVMWGTLLAVAPALTTIGEELELAFAELGLVFSIPILMLALFAFPGGLLTDRVGPRKTGAIGATLIALGGMLRATSTGLAPLVLWSAVFGLGWGLSLPTLPKIIGGWFDPRHAGTLTGIYTIGIYVGAGVATAVTFFGAWRLAVITWGILALLVALLWWALVRDPPNPLVERRSSLRSILTNRSIWILTVLFLLGANVTFYTLTGWLPTILSLRIAPTMAALLASLLSFSAAAATLIIPALSDRLGRRKAFLWIPAAAGAAASYPIFAAEALLTATAVAILGVAISAIFVVCFILPIELVPREMVGSVTGLMLAGYAGGVIGPWLAGVSHDLTASFLPTIVILVVSFGVAMVLSFLLPETGRRNKTQRLQRDS